MDLWIPFTTEDDAASHDQPMQEADRDAEAWLHLLLPYEPPVLHALDAAARS